MTPEFSRPIRIDMLGPAPRRVEIEAGEAERAALAERFALVSIDSLGAWAEVARNGDTITARGSLKAAVVQSCVASGDPVPERVAEDFEIHFRPPPEAGSPDDEVELGEAELDVVFYDGAAVDLGEAVAESLSLALNPYPRSPAAEAALREAGVKSEEEARAESSPFAVLKGLKDRME
ncbi:MAG TPA: DUF177 domain-containing protein [Allosphingosinicella sp.]|nr:DUF177 domain-containing protein [Allosphingosinicella sp.]